MKRRKFFRSLTGTAAALAAAGATAQQVAQATQATQAIEPGKWSAAAHKRIQSVIAQFGNSAPSYDPKRRPYAVFDWDNTSIMNDTEEALFMYQINHLQFKLSPPEFAAIIRQGVPAGDFSADYKNADGKPVSLEAIAADLDADYAYLHANFKGMQGSKSLEEIQSTEQFTDFKAKLLFVYDAINDSYGPNIGYPWVIYFFANMSTAEVAKLAEASNDLNLGDALRKARYTSPKALPGRAGIVGVSHTHGLRLTPEIASAMHALRSNGIDVFVSTASLEDVVRVFASLPKYGFHVTPENVLGLRLETADGVFLNQYKKDWPLNWGPGKTIVIQRELAGKKGYGPLLVFGDSDGDYDMLRDFADTQAGLIVNRLKKGKIGSLCQLAASQTDAASPRFVLQGRDERTGQWLPEQRMIKLGTTELKLLA